MDSFSNTIVLKNETSLPSGGPSPPDPLRGGGVGVGVIAFQWPGRPHPAPEKILATPLQYNRKSMQATFYCASMKSYEWTQIY